VVRRIEDRGVIETAHRALMNCGQVLRYAIATGRAERDQVRAAYNYADYLPERRKMMQAWADYLDGLRAGADVVGIATAKLA
jgi:hypothetical protein